MAEENLSAADARDHLQMVDRILSRTEETVQISGLPFLVWGIYGSVENLGAQLVPASGPIATWWNVASIVLLAAILLVFVSLGRRNMRSADRVGVLDRHVYNLFLIAFAVAMLTMLLGSHIFANWAQSAVWSLMFGITMMYCAVLVRSRVILAGGSVLIASIFVANFLPLSVGYVLACGDLFGMAAAGIILMMGRR